MNDNLIMCPERNQALDTKISNGVYRKMKNNNSKLKWWEKKVPAGLGLAAKGALVGLILSIALLFLPFGKSAGPAPSYGLLFLINLPVLPIFRLLAAHLIWPLAHFISWIIGGIFYAFLFTYIFRWMKRKKLRMEIIISILIIIVIFALLWFIF